MTHSISRLLVALAVMTASLTVWGQGFYLDGRKAVQDKTNGFWLCSVPQDVFGTDWTAAVDIDSTWTDMTINGIPVADGDTYTFEGIEGGAKYPFTAMAGDSEINGEITFTWLPVMELSGTFGNEYAEGTVSLNTPDATGKSDMLAKLKWRGGITNTGDKHKRNYHIKFIDENGDKKNRRMLDMRKDNHWKLDGGQMDLLRIRNRVCSDLWLDMSRKPWHYELDSTVINGSRGQVTELFLNGEYYGIYSLIEPIDRKQLGLVKYDTIAGEFHGQQWTSKYKYPTYTFPMYNNNLETWNGNEVSYPDFEEVNPTDWSTLYNAFEFARSVDAVDNWQLLTDSIGNYFDMPVLEDYFIFIVALQAFDNEVKNIYYSCYDKTLGPPRLTMTPWDLDVSLGSQAIVGLDVNPEQGLRWIMHLAMGDSFNHSDYYHKRIVKRYWQLRDTWLSTENMVARFRQAVNELEDCGAAAREEARWSGDSDISGKVLDISAEMEYVADWITRRMAYLDENIFVKDYVIGDVDGSGDVNISDVTALISYVLNDSGDIIVDNADVNDDGQVNISDVTDLISLVLNS